MVFVAATMWPGASASAQKFDFQDTQSYQSGADVSQIQGWAGSSPATASIAERVDEGGQVERCLEILGSSDPARKIVQNFNATKVSASGVVFFDLLIKPIADRSKEPQFTIDINGAQIAFLKEADLEGRFASVKAADGSSLQIGRAFELDASNQSAEWIRVTVRADLKAGVWDFFLNGKLAAINQPLFRAGKSLAANFYPSSFGSYYLDDLQCSSVNPLFADSDSDGIPDAIEKANGSSPFFADRQSDVNADGLSNIANFKETSQGGGANAPPGFSRVLYVDNSVGSDQKSGLLPYQADGEGPLLSLKEAFRQTDDHTLIVILPGNKVYDWPEQMPEGLKELNIQTLDTVNVE